MTNLKSLIERVEKAEGPNREIDLDVWLFETNRTVEWRSNMGSLSGPIVVAFVDPGERSNNFRLDSRFERIVPTYTSSLDAALALIERKLPGRLVLFASYPADEEEGSEASGQAEIRERLRYGSERLCICNARTPALALIAALLRAIEAEKAA